MENGEAMPTGCYLCGYPGHWSRDCPNPNPNLLSSSPTNHYPNPNFYSGSASKPVEEVPEKPKNSLRKRPKPTPELLLSKEGLRYVLRHVLCSLKARGCEDEVCDLENLIGLYTWLISHLLHFDSADQFVDKVEKVGATKRIKKCIEESRETVANEGNTTKLHEPPVENGTQNHEQGNASAHSQNNQKSQEAVHGSQMKVSVHGYRVMEDNVKIMDDIFAKYGDIASESHVRTPHMRAGFFDMLCNVIKVLMNRSARSLRPHELALLSSSLGDAEAVGFNVGWVRERIDSATALAKYAREASAFECLSKRVEEWKAALLELEQFHERIGNVVKATRLSLTGGENAEIDLDKSLGDGLL